MVGSLKTASPTASTSWHWPIQVALTPERTGLDGGALDVLRVLVTLVVASASYVFVEQPVRRGALRGVPVRLAAPVGFAIVAGMLVVTTSGSEAPAAFLQSSSNRYFHVGPPRPVPTSDGPGPLRITLVGDSVAASLTPGLRAAAKTHHIAFSALGAAACSMLEGAPGIR